jgi:hypothetical protein
MIGATELEDEQVAVISPKGLKPRNIDTVVNGKRYQTEKATLIASNIHWNGRDYRVGGKNTYLFRTPNDNYFVQYESDNANEPDRIVPLNVDEAREQYAKLPSEKMPFLEAFPGTKFEEG